MQCLTKHGLRKRDNTLVGWGKVKSGGMCLTDSTQFTAVRAYLSRVACTSMP